MKRILILAATGVLAFGLAGCTFAPSASACSDASAVITELDQVLSIGSELSNDADAKLKLVERIEVAAEELTAISERAADAAHEAAVADLSDAVSALASSSKAALSGHHADPSSDAARVELAIHDLDQVCG